MVEHPKSKSTGGFYRADVSTCTSAMYIHTAPLIFIYPDWRCDPALVRRGGLRRGAVADLRGDGAAAEGGAGGVAQVPPPRHRRDLHGRREVLRETGSFCLLIFSIKIFHYLS